MITIVPWSSDCSDDRYPHAWQQACTSDSCSVPIIIVCDLPWQGKSMGKPAKKAESCSNCPPSPVLCIHTMLYWLTLHSHTSFLSSLHLNQASPTIHATSGNFPHPTAATPSLWFLCHNSPITCALLSTSSNQQQTLQGPWHLSAPSPPLTHPLSMFLV